MIGIFIVLAIVVGSVALLRTKKSNKLEEHTQEHAPDTYQEAPSMPLAMKPALPTSSEMSELLALQMISDDMDRRATVPADYINLH